jgi:hypothetical protein
MRAGGKCWTECEYVTEIRRQRYYVVSRYIEWWRVNTTLKEYYEVVTGPVTSHVGTGIAVATASQGGRNVMQAMGRETVRALIGSTFPEAVPTLGAAAPGAITASTAIGAVGLGLTIYVSATYLMRNWVEDAVEISHGWELVPEQSGYGDIEEPPVRRSTPFWKRCSEIRDCPEPQEPPKPTEPQEPRGVLPGGGTTPRTPTPGGTSSPPRPGWPVAREQPVAATQTATASATATVTATATPSATATAVATPTPALVTGGYRGSVTVASDPAGHRCCVTPSDRWDVLQVRNTQTGAITITLSNVLPGITLTGPVPGVAQPFTASGAGTVAGFPNTSVAFTGTATAEAGVNGTLTVGANGTLPQGQAISFSASLQRAP